MGSHLWNRRKLISHMSFCPQLHRVLGALKHNKYRWYKSVWACCHPGSCLFKKSCFIGLCQQGLTSRCQHHLVVQSHEGVLPPHSPSKVGWSPHRHGRCTFPWGSGKQAGAGWVSAGSHLAGCSLFLLFHSLSLVCGVELKMNQGSALEICEVPAPERDQRKLSLQGSLN